MKERTIEELEACNYENLTYLELVPDTDTYKTIDLPDNEHTTCTDTTKDGQLRTPTKPLESGEQEKSKNEPIMQFESQEQLNASLKEWQGRLGLNDWIIKAKIISWHDFDSSRAENIAAEISQVNQSKSAEIHIRPKEEIVVATVKKQPQELSLIHELLHIRHFPERTTWDNIQSVAWEETQHQNLDEIATALIMAKYNLTLDWFRVED